ncbi:myotubularin-related protein DDB_G0290005-like [Drosophila eugracilis]|uniref:myotubularin-related protein DDB_G0290005-like n=1 Tax=Drosophila eugracilis TaxID=29029 RepID=UPI001BD95434|nr:myotubularin-related protein DDB_G0290005-like [Drosophila eugracilis]
MWKICIFTLVIAVVAATTTETITNDLTAKSNRTLLKISTDEPREFSTVGGSTSTATPTTTATTSTTTTRATTVSEENVETPTTLGLMTTTEKMEPNVLGEIGSRIRDALHRIKLSEKPVDGTTTTEQPEAVDQDDQEEEEVTPTISPLQIQMQAAASYQVAETLADLNEEERARYDAMLAQQPTASKLNIVDLYPLKLDDFQPIIQNDNDELIKQRTIFTQPENAEEYKQNLMPNEVELMVNKDVDEVKEKIKINKEKLERPTTVKPTTIRPNLGTTADFTGKLLADQDDLITEIESKFQLHETTTNKPKVTTTRQHPGNTFIDRRVKKSFEFPMQHRASDVMAMPHIDFANTKFQTDADAPNPPASHPEFSTTKFYNSKELYNEMLLHNKRKLMKAAKAEGSPIKSAEDTTRATTNLNVTPEGKTFNPTTTTTTGTTILTATRIIQTTTTTPVKVTTSTAESTATTATTTGSPTATTNAGKYQKELKRAKLLLKVLTPPKSNDNKPTVAGESPSPSPSLSSYSSTTTTTMATVLATARTRPSPANPTKTAASKPIARPRILSRLQEKINSLECEIPNVPQDSHLWRGNETHELLLPIVVSPLQELSIDLSL